MKYYIKQRVFSFSDRFTIYDENGNDAFYAQGEIFTLGKKLRIYSLSGQELSYIEQKVFSFLPKYNIFRNGYEKAEVVKSFTFFKPHYFVNGLGLKVEGDFLAHEYSFYDYGGIVASVSKEWLTFADAYTVDISSSQDAVDILSVVLIIDACISGSQNQSF